MHLSSQTILGRVNDILIYEEKGTWVKTLGTAMYPDVALGFSSGSGVAVRGTHTDLQPTLMVVVASC